MATAPLLSVVIPTFKRPVTLRRAIDSAFEAVADGELEVVVVPNGHDDSWKRTAAGYASDSRVKWHYLATGGASGARNHGLAAATGKYVRFLDDDDVLYPSAAQQLQALDDERGDISTGPLNNVYPGNSVDSVTGVPDSADFVTAALRITTVGMCQGSVFRTDLVRACAWPTNAVLYDDYIWMLEVAKHREWNWKRWTTPVAAYMHHFDERLSYARRSGSNSEQVITAILALYESLQRQSRDSAQRRRAVAGALLTHAHSAFPAAPLRLTRAIRTAREIDAGAAPLQAIFERHPKIARHVALAEWAALLPRYLTRGWRRLGWRARRFIH
ncbi:glycosyltransferase family 2 protein [Lysobacter claricitrinus]|uniref:glycosyltransferase family 2 protein n=1 Tax=Lysobacter claricitrinus TaxID=3367728 RepID=UPI0037DB8AE1